MASQSARRRLINVPYDIVGRASGSHSSGKGCSMETDSHDVIVTRRFDAPQELMASMERSRSGHAVVGTAGLHIAPVPHGFREGGTTLVCMRSDQGWGTTPGRTRRSSRWRGSSSSSASLTRTATPSLQRISACLLRSRSRCGTSEYHAARRHHDGIDRPRIRIPGSADRRRLASRHGGMPRQDDAQRRGGTEHGP